MLENNPVLNDLESAILIIDQENIVQKAIEVVKKSRNNIRATMLLSEELAQPIRQEYFSCLQDKINQGVILRRICFGSENEFQEFITTNPSNSTNSHHILSTTQDYFRMLMVDDSQLLFSLKTPKARLFFFTEDQNLVREYRDYFDEKFNS
jgi:sugar-specific transcriptional regulator TrmB